MKIAIASGKGGTGKTTVATNLAYFLANNSKRTFYADCDVEEPNGHLFLKPDWKQSHDVTVKIPKIDDSKCDYCGECSKICQFNALAVLSNKVLVFPTLCHSCSGCFNICPQKAIEEVDRIIGVVKFGIGKGVFIYEGRLNVGEAISPPIIKYLKNIIVPSDFTIIDCPPGTSCPVIEAVKDTDYVILVTEPTPFGLNDLELAVGMVRELNLPFGVVVNRYGMGDDRIHTFCNNQGIDILLEIPNDRKIAEVCSEGKLIIENLPEYTVYFDTIIKKILHPLKAMGAR
ncbi:MAG: P-loop NTPase [candidate division Zixibacteria bacterium]|nr:P-loop NTPase [candidate division Zixibacteria bacterium]